MIKPHYVSLLLANWLLLLAGGSAADRPIDFNEEIRPLLSNNCFACHGPDEEERKADLRLDTHEGAIEDLGGYAALTPGDAEASELFYRITTDDPDDLMPPKGKGARFTPEQAELIQKWIEQGGNYERHWSYVPPQRPEMPKVQQSDWPANPIDRFILARLEAEGLTPSPEADRWTLARRVALDLTGLPPSWEEAQQFVEDSKPRAYERYVDQQLAKPSYGEHWARTWLDLARYADSAGYADDPPRTIWAYRDYVIRSLNANKPFDQFTIEQIAGDLLEKPTEEQLVATAFHRNTMTNNEGGTNDEQFRNEAVVDRVNTTMAVWMGTTMACAQCHTHKYDPITHEEYFQFFDFFNQSLDADKKDESPLLDIWTDEQEAEKAAWRERISELKTELASQTSELDLALNGWIQKNRTEPKWSALKPSKVDSPQANLQVQEDGLIQLEGERPKTAVWTVRIPTEKGQTLAALRLEVPAEQQKNFVLSQISATWKPANPAKVEGRYVRLELSGKDRMLHVAEVEVLSGEENLALKGAAKQSSTDFGGDAQRAIDGNTDGDYVKKSVTHTGKQSNPWWEVDLGEARPIDSIRIWNRMDGGRSMAERIAGYRVQVLDAEHRVVWEDTPAEVPEPSSNFALSGTRKLPFEVAYADFTQSKFEPADVLAAKADPKKGWAIGGGVGQPHELSLFLKAPQKMEAGDLVLRLAQTSEYEDHVLTHLRLSATDDPGATEWASLPHEIRALLRKGNHEKAETDKLAGYYRTIAPELKSQRSELAKLEKKLADVKPSTTVPVMREMGEETQRDTFVQIRGNYLSLGSQVSMGVPATFNPLPEDMPKNRLALAHWLVDEANPLTARVIANRHWEKIFGIGIVETSEEFGSQGELPSHPELLDWLAVELQESGWDLKSFLKLLVTSATYRQESVASPALRKEDPFNRLLARGPRFRVTAEMVRDQALLVSGLLSDKMYGPPVKPPQPELGLKAAFGPTTDWKTSEGVDRYRRGIYTTWRRSSPYPSMATFDAPNREVCTVRRTRTNTPLQALVTMNDPVYVEAAQALARRMADVSDDPAGQIRFGLEQALVRPAKPEEVSRLTQLYQTAFERYSQSPEQAQLMAEDPLGPVPDGADPVQLAALTVVGNVLLNLDELFLKR